MIPHRPRCRPSWRLPYALAAGLALLVAGRAAALDERREDVQAFIAEMADRNGFDAASLARTLAQVESRPSIVAAMTRPAEKTLTWPEYRARFIDERRVSRGVETAREHAGPLAKAAASGVPEDIMLAIVGVETSYGENVGRFRVIDALATLAFDYPPRSKFFRSELEQFLLMVREESLDALVPVGSYAGAMGVPQFMPSSFRRYAVDGDGDGRRDLWNDWADVFASVGNYLAVHGWRPGEPVMAVADASGADLEGLATDRLELTETVKSLQDRGVRFTTTLPPEAPAVLVALRGSQAPEHRVGFTNYYAITRYNRSALYASAVNDLAEAIASARAAAPAPNPAASP